jgi:GGDEF domain-containing protein
MMASDPFFEEDFRVLTPDAFDFVLYNELKRAIRSQNFLTLVLVEPTPLDPTGVGQGEREQAVHEVARLIGRDVRETDLISNTPSGHLSVVLLDADFQNSLRVIERLMARLAHYTFQRPIAIEVGAACCPTHGADADTLRRAAESHPIQMYRDGRGSASNAQ